MKKKILTAIFTVGLLTASYAPLSAATQVAVETPQVEIVNERVTVEEPVAEAVETQPTLPESQIARKMTQAEKAQNAKENDSWGGAITIIAMCIVIGALIILSVLFMVFGKVSEAFLTHAKKKAKRAADHIDHDNDNHDLAPGEVIAAISLALAERFGAGHDVEDTILTIRRMQKAYSPWNSKIYNLRQSQDHHRNPSPEIKFNESKRIQI